MSIDQRFQVIDAFVTDRAFSGNPAAVCILENVISDGLRQKIASQFNLSETSFVEIISADESQIYADLRWFTPVVEVDLCGHATLAAAHSIFERYPDAASIHFQTRSGVLTVEAEGEFLKMSFPQLQFEAVDSEKFNLLGLPCRVIDTFEGMDVALVLESAEYVRSWNPNLVAVSSVTKRGLIVTAADDSESPHDFISRFFAPRHGIDEDPVTGSAHCWLAPYWSRILGKHRLVALQASPRGGVVDCEVLDKKICLRGRTRVFSEGTISQKVLA